MMKSTALIHLLFSVSLLFHSPAAALLAASDLDAAMSSLRSHGYNLFPDAIATSDLRFSLLSSPSADSAVTLFAPPDPLLFSLDLSAASPDQYIRSLLRHASPSFLPVSSLRGRVGDYVETLLPRDSLLIEKCSLVLVNRTVLESLSVDGVRISVPDLYLGSGVVAHGLDGILAEPAVGEWNFDDERPYSVWGLGKSGENRSAATGTGGGGSGLEHGKFAKVIRGGRSVS